MDYIVWDWNGTILDDVDACVQSNNIVLEGQGLPLIKSSHDYRSLFTFPVRDYYIRLGFDFEKTPFTQLAHQFMDEYMVLSRECPLTEHIEEVFSSLKEKGYTQIILSASKRENLLKQVQMFNIEHYFDEILGIDDVYAATKVDLANAFCKRVSPRSITVIGDTYHDYEVARALNAECFLYARGHQIITPDLDSSYQVVDRIDAVLEHL